MIWILCCASGLPRMHLFRMLDEVRRLSGCSYTTTHPSDLLHGLAIWLATKKKSGWKQNKGKERLEFTFKPMSISRQPGTVHKNKVAVFLRRFAWSTVDDLRLDASLPILLGRGRALALSMGLPSLATGGGLNSFSKSYRIDRRQWSVIQR